MLSLKRFPAIVLVVLAAACTGCASNPMPPSGPFTGTWSGTNPNNSSEVDTLTLSQAGTSVTGSFDENSPITGNATYTVNGTASGNAATVAIADDGVVFFQAVPLTLTGASLSMQLSYSGSIVTEVLTTGPPPLTTATNIAGTWTTPSPVTLYAATTACGPQVIEFILKRTATWVIAGTGNTVSVNETYSDAGSSVANSCNLAVPQNPSPQQYTGSISGTTLTVTGVDGQEGVFTITSNNLAGTWNDSSCLIYCQDTYSNSKTYILTK